VTLVCIYFGAWEATKRFGVPDVEEFAERGDSEFRYPVKDGYSPMPFCVRVTQLKVRDAPGGPQSIPIIFYRRHYLWMFGWIVHLTYEKGE
jgi:hypothetical protein